MVAKDSKKKKVKKNVPTGVAHINSTFNNTIITLQTLWAIQFHGVRRVIRVLWFKKIHTICCSTCCWRSCKKGHWSWNEKYWDNDKGPGNGRESAIRALGSTGLNITVIKDIPNTAMDVDRRRKKGLKFKFLNQKKEIFVINKNWKNLKNQKNWFC